MSIPDPRPLRLLTIGHSYGIALNRRLANEMAVVGKGKWEVTCVAPEFLHGDLRPVHLERAESEVCKLKPVPLRGSKRIHTMLYGGKLKKILREPWDVIHCWQEPFILVGGQVARWSPRKAKLVFATFQNISKNYPPPFNFVERYSMRRAAAWIAFGQTVEDALGQRTGYTDKPHRIIPLGVDLDRFKADDQVRRRIRAKLDWPRDKAPVVGYLGRFVQEKGLELLMNALAEVKVPWRALLVGSGPMEGELREWAAKTDGRVRIVNDVKHDAVPEYLNAMDILCAPSQTTPRWREQLGRMLLEAFACQVPVIASDSGEIPRVVSDAGIIVGEADQVGWTAALSRMLTEPALRAEYGAKGRARAEAEFAWPLIARRHLEFFEELLAQ
jgi:glycosyltransferase involved in cell wall biosynthesis